MNYFSKEKLLVLHENVMSDPVKKCCAHSLLRTQVPKKMFMEKIKQE